MPSFSCDLGLPGERFDHVWEHGVGSDHAPIALRADWQQHLRRCRRDLGFGHVRFHGLLSDDMGTLICQQEELLYSFFNVDQIFDFLLSIGVRPFVELSFMPATLASGAETVFRYRANVTPPRDYDEWATLIDILVRHWIDRYGAVEVRQWLFEVWNEPNLTQFWTGGQAAYFKLYKRTVEAIKQIDGALQVGGPATAQNAWIEQFLEYCRAHGLAADFVSTHYYPTDAFGEIGADTVTQLAHAPRDVMRDRAAEARKHAGERPLYYTEWNASSNPRDPLHDGPFAAAYALRIIMNVAPLVQGYSFWTCSDIFAENYFPSVPFHGGFGLLNLHGIPKPVYRAFELLHRTGTERLLLSGSHDTVDAWVVRGDGRVTVLVTNHAQPRHAIATEIVRVTLRDMSSPRRVRVERIDESNANPVKVWHEMGNPVYLTATQVDELRASSELVAEPLPYQYEDRALSFTLTVPPHGTAAVTIEGLEAARTEAA